MSTLFFSGFRNGRTNSESERRLTNSVLGEDEHGQSKTLQTCPQGVCLSNLLGICVKASPFPVGQAMGPKGGRRVACAIQRSSVATLLDECVRDRFCGKTWQGCTPRHRQILRKPSMET